MNVTPSLSAMDFFVSEHAPRVDLRVEFAIRHGESETALRVISCGEAIASIDMNGSISVDPGQAARLVAALYMVTATLVPDASASHMTKRMPNWSDLIALRTDDGDQPLSGVKC